MTTRTAAAFVATDLNAPIPAPRATADEQDTTDALRVRLADAEQRANLAERRHREALARNAATASLAAEQEHTIARLRGLLRDAEDELASRRRRAMFAAQDARKEK